MKFEEEDDESKVLDELNKDIENNIKLEANIINNINNAENSLKKEDFKKLVDVTYHFKQNIERVWNILKNFEMILILNNSNHYPCIIKRGLNTFNLGNIFEGKLFALYEFHAKVIKEKNFPEYKKLETIFYLENGEILKLKLILYKVTQDDSCVLNWISKNIPKYGEDIILQIKEKFKGKELFQKIENILEKQSIDLFQYESGIIPGKMEEIWNILTDNSKLVTIAPNNKCFVPININNVKVGEIVNVGMNIKGIEGALEIKLDLKEEKKGWNKWIFGYSILGGQPFKVIKQSVFVQLTKINKEETQLSVFTKIHDPVNNEMFKLLSQKKKYVIHSLKDYFENFYCPDDEKNNDL
jgi:hypothetical protein